MKEVIIKYFGDKIESHEIVEEVGELIRCKDCKHSEECLQGVVIDDTYVPTEWCSQGERRTDNG